MDRSLIANLSDQELFDKLSSYGVNCGPVTGTTRTLYESILYKKVNNERNSDEDRYDSQKESEVERMEQDEVEEIYPEQLENTRKLESSYNYTTKSTLSSSYHNQTPTETNLIFSPKPIDSLHSSYYKSTPKDDNLRLSPSTTTVTVPETYIDEYGREQVRFVKKRVPRSQFSDQKVYKPRDIQRDFDIKNYSSSNKSKNRNKNNINMIYLFIIGFILLTLVTFFFLLN